MTAENQKRSNNRLGLSLALIAVVFFLGVIARFVLLGG